ncbi:MAG: hypothetical protein IJ545_04675 [Alphaproteobacteria bacterium]|nr:hypothetical protein [Alphaproteobacteria bacterium]
MATKIQLRQDTAANWNSANPVLASGEIGVDLTNKDFKVGDGSTSWKRLLGVQSEARIAEELARGTYRGTNLEEKFADEIATAGSVAAWLHARCQAGNFEGIYPFDYFFDTTVAQTVDGTSVAGGQQRKCVIAGIDMYYNTGDSSPYMPHHLTIFAGLSTANVLFNPSNNNNGSSYSNNPFLASKLNAVLNGVNNATTNNIGDVGFDGTGGCYLNTFSTALKSIMVEQRVYMPKRYSADATLTNHTGCEWLGRGTLFAPSEVEAYGDVVHSQNSALAQCEWEGYGPYCQWDIFKTAAGRLLFGRTSFWLSSVAGGGSTFACSVSGHGYAHCNSTTNTYNRAPLCFHIA